MYTRDDINKALKTTDFMERQQLIPSVDISGHGTQDTTNKLQAAVKSNP
ncbi:hypothetical protein [Anaeromicropila herbilytica]